MPFFTSPPERTAWSRLPTKQMGFPPRRFLRRGGRACPCGRQSPIAAAPNPPAGATHLDAVTPNTRFLTVTGADIGEQTFLSGPVIYSPIETILDPCAAVSEENLLEAADRGTFGTFPQGPPPTRARPQNPILGLHRISHTSCPTPLSTPRPAESTPFKIL